MAQSVTLAGTAASYCSSLDPFVPMLRAGDHRIRQQQWQRRATILSSARRQLARKGYDGIVVRTIAEECNVSVQTIYNLVGDKAALVGEAIAEYLVAMGEEARRQTGYPNYVLALTDTIWRSVVDYADFNLEANKSCFGPDCRPRPRVLKCSSDITHAGMLELGARGSLRLNVLTKELANTIILVIGLLVHNGLVERVSPEALRYNLLTTTGRLLISAVRPDEAEAIEAWLERTLSPRFQDSARN